MYALFNIPDGTIAVAPNSVDSPLAVPADDESRALAASIASPQRRAETIIWRNILCRQCGALGFDYLPSGAPVMRCYGQQWQIGVSHSRSHVAVVWSRNRCAVDIESLSRSYSRIEQRYVSAAERLLPCASMEWFNALLWCAKETMYKFSGLTGLDLMDDLRVTNVELHDSTDSQVTGIATGLIGARCEIVIRFMTFDGDMMAYAVADEGRG